MGVLAVHSGGYTMAKSMWGKNKAPAPKAPAPASGTSASGTSLRVGDTVTVKGCKGTGIVTAVRDSNCVVRLHKPKIPTFVSTNTRDVRLDSASVRRA